MAESKSLYARLGGYDAVAAVVGNLLPRLMSDAQLGRFWEHRGEDGLRREKQLLIDFLCSCTGGPLLYTGRDMKTTHLGMRISESDWSVFITHIKATLNHFELPPQEHDEVVSLIESAKDETVEC